MKVYLAGPINNCTDEEAYGWRRDLKLQFRDTVIQPVDPLDRDFRGKEVMNYRDIVENDLEAIRKSDCVLAYLWKFDQPYFGTSMEIIYANLIGVPVVTVMPFPTTVKGDKLLKELGGKNLNFHPWIQYYSKYVVRTMDEAIALLYKMSNKEA